MKFFEKNPNSEILLEGLLYRSIADRKKIRNILINEQKGFCAYSERFIKNTDSVDIEHFDGRLKDSESDNYYNWYAVLTWLNRNKPKKINPFLPILLPFSTDLKSRILYEDGLYKPVDSQDVEAKNLIEYLGLNKLELYNDRRKQVERIRELFGFLNYDVELIKLHLIKHKENLSFITALESEFKFDFYSLLDK